MSKRNYLNVSESFFSLQGEGSTSGVPSYFIRLTNCNLNCGMKSETLQKMRRLIKDGKDSYSQEVVDIMIPETENASWICDSIPVWVKGKKVAFESLVEKWNDPNEFLKNDIDDGIIHLIWTGGEPCMPVNQECIVSFLDWYTGAVYSYTNPMYNEIETNGTQYIQNDMMLYLSQINCSVKLSNSGHLKEQRIVPDALKRIMEHKNYWFKFVVSEESDMIEIFDDFITPFNIPKQRILLMPALSKQVDFHERTKFIYELAKKYRVRATHRMHISAWDQVVGV